eukprot:gnl/TRDRNA2_/TRDRNA2_186581_c0_seq1.p1 gnl/TRDRNA2_/TRDRNA2_186581_c0~~gnl/TRDRNA2_/TRDRNA2_186581_c0_seq1.p1  ORF type:complete len:395 (-),score=60.16 gnl/TRDRNA2_/TRDRNA2_186581_c0_seq1:82-1266(-)
MRSLMLSVAVTGILLACAVESSSPGSSTVDGLFDRVPADTSLPRADLDDTIFGKSGHFAVPAPSSQLVARAQPPLYGRFRSVPNVVAHALPEGNGARQQYMVEGSDSSPIAVLDRRAAMAGSAFLASFLSLADPEPALAKDDELLAQIETFIKKQIKSKELDISVPDILRLVLHDTLTYDPSGKTNVEKGGFSGSIRFPEELKRPENAGLEPVVKKLEALQKDLQKETGLPITFADTEAEAALMIVAGSFQDVLCTKIAPDQAFFDCDKIYSQFGNAPRKLPLGRRDATEPAPAGRVPWTGSSVDDFKAAAKKLRLSVSELCALSPGILPDGTGEEFLKQDKQCAGILEDQRMSKATKTRTNFETTLLDALALMVAGRARVDPKGYGPGSSLLS